MPPNDAGDENPGYEDSSESMEKLQREYLEFAREQMLDLKKEKKDRARRPAMTFPPGNDYMAVASGRMRPSVSIRRIDNGWLVHYWVGRDVEVFCKTEEVGPTVSKALPDLEKFEKGGDTFLTQPPPSAP